jgi:hypothetical protein
MMDLPSTHHVGLAERDVAVISSPANHAIYRPPELPQSALSGSSPIDVVVSYSITGRPQFETIFAARPSLAASRLDELRESALSELNRYAQYERGWDGYDGESFCRPVLELGRLLVDHGVVLLRAQDASPSEITTGPASDGSLDVEFIVGGKRLILTIDATATRYAIYAEHDGRPYSEADVSDLARLVRWIGWVGGPSYLPVPVGSAAASS